MKHASLAGDDTKKQRDAHDWYPTPPHATRALLEREEFVGSIWEPACGDGAISKTLPPESMASDLYDRGYGEVGIDFLSEYRQVNNIITNPPFSLAEEFVKHALMCTDRKVAMLLKLNFIAGIGRYQDLFSYTPLSKVYVFCRRLSFDKPNGENDGRGLLEFAWFVWEHGYTDKPRIDWIP